MNKVCQKCVNFLDKDDGSVECDYEYFTDIKLEQAILFVPEMFDCIEFEDLNDI